jgi:acid stress chaperone HdeB
MRVGFIASVLLLVILGASAVRAQVTVDVAKITCRQFLLGHVGGSTRSVANWLSGYYSGKRGSTVIEVGSMQKNVRDLERYCRKNYEMPVMDAAKNALGAEK